mmetsp:Transcript_50732/g.163139  ORF Transcript_50732/g.163139 Transcript_50732/m.163139 type:complete len:100 (-) Transcript_50732:167-466(-)
MAGADVEAPRVVAADFYIKNNPFKKERKNQTPTALALLFLLLLFLHWSMRQPAALSAKRTVEYRELLPIAEAHPAALRNATILLAAGGNGTAPALREDR